MNMNKHFKNITRGYAMLWLVLLLLHVNRTDAQVQVLSIDEVLETIDKQNPMLQESEYKVKALEEYANGSKSWMAPMIGFGPYWYPYPGEKLMSPAEEGMYMATIEQDIPNPAKLKAKKNYMVSRIGVEQEARAIQLNRLRTDAKNYYYRWLTAEKKKSVLRENIEIAETMLKLARIRYPYNQGSLGSIYKAEARLHEVENMIVMLEGDIEESSFRLKALMNLDHNALIMIDTATVVRIGTEILNYDTADLRSERRDIRQMDRTIESMRLNQRLQSMGAKPDFKVRFEHMDPKGAGMPRQYSLMAMVTIPIAPWSSKMYRSETNAMKYEIEAMKRSREAILLETKGMLSGMAKQIARMEQQISNYELKIIPALKKNYETLMIAYEENTEDLPMVVDAWEALNMAQMNHLEKLTDYYEMIVRYENETYQ